MPLTGTVYLVGAGPGDPGLLTLRGLECLSRADLVLYDGLVNPLLLRHVRGTAERTARVSGPEGSALPQDEINQRLIAAARQGKTVVRLKGGDPFLFGRGAEEAAALRNAGIPYEIVPGVTAAVAAGAYAGIPFTHRLDASAVAFVTGHEDPRKSASALDYHALAAFPGTLVFYMGLRRIHEIAAALIAAGKPAATPAAVICRATTPLQQSVTATLDRIAAAVDAADLNPPSLIVIGDCVSRREQIEWFEQRPLFGMRIGITRPERQADDAIARCLELGAEPLLLPTIEIHPPTDWRPVDDVLARLHEFDWLVFTSANGVRYLMERLWEQGGDPRRIARIRLAAIGDATAEALARWRLRADLVPESFRAEALAEALQPHVAGCRVLWARASRGRDVLPHELAAAGADVEQVVTYRNADADSLPAAALAMIEQGAVHWIALSSPSIATNLVRLLTPAARRHLGTVTRLAAISPVTAEAAHEAGLPIAAVASEYTWNGLFTAIASVETSARTPLSER